jgi:hypothetical protein
MMMAEISGKGGKSGKAVKSKGTPFLMAMHEQFLEA